MSDPEELEFEAAHEIAVEAYDKAIAMMRHSFDDEGRCMFCDVRWHKAVGTACVVKERS